MNHKPGPVGVSALSSTPSTRHLRPIFWMLPSAFSSMVVRPPAMLPLVGCESDRSLVLWRFITSWVGVDMKWEFFLSPSFPPRGGPRYFPPVRFFGLPQNDAARRRVDERTEVQVEVGAELQPPVRVRQRHRALDVVLDRLRGGVGKVVDRNDDDMVAHADAAVLAPVAVESGLREVHGAHHRFVLMLCTWACSPTWIGATTRPMSTPYLITVASLTSALMASLWPIGMSVLATISMSLSWSMIQPVSFWPAFTPSTTTTPTESFSSCTTKWIIAGLRSRQRPIG